MKSSLKNIKKLIKSSRINKKLNDVNKKLNNNEEINDVNSELNELNDKCELCDHICETKYFQHNFKNWTSGNNDIDKYIQDTQLSVHYYVSDPLEWIPYDRFNNIEFIVEVGVGKAYRANWIDGCRDYWDCVDQKLIRTNQNMDVILKNLNDPSEVTLIFNKVN
jgi:hypothetical protein